MKEKTIEFIRQADGIYMDTCTLMNCGFGTFLAKYSRLIRSEKKKIVVLQDVRLELLKLSRSANERTKAIACRAFKLLDKYEDIFEVERRGFDDEDMEKAFADPKLLAELTLYKQEYNLLLITNDKKLSQDALKLNRQSSCSGNDVMTAFIGYEGDLMHVPYAGRKTSPASAKAADNPPELQNTADQEPPLQTLPEEKRRHGFAYGVKAIAAFIAGILFEKKRKYYFEMAVSMYS